ncbi:hypothetical protein NPA08_01125 [Mycoplasmopsis citelli]|uniref:hypothetical protein n=1 Tax=Mycoplasmopsis citelli TaxID=171281 RepID=UPI00211499FD|nr:hypothetical protein [Mycoplasmopsis citelli]UUD36424.1 hypothetical protein NPA08_01125 [Mycoplasmopsis citelli]
MNKSTHAKIIKWSLWITFTLNLTTLLILSQSISGIILYYPALLKLIVTLITMFLWTSISIFMVVHKISKITIHYMVMFILGIALALSWLPLYNKDSKTFNWIYFPGDIFVISIILALNYFLNIIFVKRKMILRMRKYLKIN